MLQQPLDFQWVVVDATFQVDVVVVAYRMQMEEVLHDTFHMLLDDDKVVGSHMQHTFVVAVVAAVADCSCCLPRRRHPRMVVVVVVATLFNSSNKNAIQETNSNSTVP